MDELRRLRLWPHRDQYEITVGYGGGQTLFLSIVFSHDESLGVGGHGISLRFDMDLQNELNILGAGERAGTTYAALGTMAAGTYSPLVTGAGIMGLGGFQESSAIEMGQLTSSARRASW